MLILILFHCDDECCVFSSRFSAGALSVCASVVCHQLYPVRTVVSAVLITADLTDTHCELNTSLPSTRPGLGQVLPQSNTRLVCRIERLFPSEWDQEMREDETRERLGPRCSVIVKSEVEGGRVCWVCTVYCCYGTSVVWRWWSCWYYNISYKHYSFS